MDLQVVMDPTVLVMQDHHLLSVQYQLLLLLLVVLDLLQIMHLRVVGELVLQALGKAGQVERELKVQ